MSFSENFEEMPSLTKLDLEGHLIKSGYFDFIHFYDIMFSNILHLSKIYPTQIHKMVFVPN